MLGSMAARQPPAHPREVTMSGRITRRGMFGLSIAAGAATWLPAMAQGQDRITILTFGGALAEAQRKTYFEPFTKATGIKVLEDEWGGEMAKLRAMVQSGNVTWDVIDVSGGQT